MTESNNIERITQPEIITGYLSRLLRGHILLGISIPGSSRSYNSIIIDIDGDRQTMLLDALHPESGHEAVMKLREFAVTAHHDGIRLGFKGYIKELVNDAGKPAYLVGYPAALIYHQQRAAYRAAVSMGDQVGIKIRSADNKTVPGLITDISLGGLGLQFEQKHALPFSNGMLLPSCQFSTPGKPEFECALEVRNIRQDDNNRFVQVGTRFIKLDKQEERQIQRFVVQLEREMIKRSQR
ncbi:flagellar brake protein [Sulfuriflexus sp.]|uniref:flagellar brake protein n=1 Tax=Sulfuriflexus sp. TaxID=2015443 RepID=UPI0028CF3E4C|nr:flagellar regulator YcgR PilZN domain-containing protein [Sulfuriflexus sp.]MDT8404498.1 flagellar regulator YcgR PilZN domain-containing protein [Sulfuriflexus sp.]